MSNSVHLMKVKRYRTRRYAGRKRMTRGDTGREVLKMRGSRDMQRYWMHLFWQGVMKNNH